MQTESFINFPITVTMIKQEKARKIEMITFYIYSYTKYLYNQRTRIIPIIGAITTNGKTNAGVKINHRKVKAKYEVILAI